jgi:UDP-glucose 4-epimerase
MTKILITGGAGFIGSHLIDNIIKNDDKIEIIVVDNLETGMLINLEEHASVLKNFCNFSIENYNKLYSVFNSFKPDIVIHAAASYKDRFNWTGDSSVNVVGGVNLIKLSKEFDVKRFIYFQTALIYDMSCHDPLIPLKTHHPIKPKCSYAISKYTTEPYLKLSGIDFISFRLANCYGPRNFSGPISIFYKKLKNDEDCYIADTRRDYVYIDDLVTIVISALDTNRKFKNNYYHISTGRDFSIYSIYETIARNLNKPLRSTIQTRKEDDVYTILLDPIETTIEFKHTPSITIEEGIPKAIEYYENLNVEFNSYTHLSIKTN